jgi:sensor histidine kinase YesM
LKKLLYILFTLSLSIISIAQEPYAIHLSKTNGLPSNSVYNVFQDRKGFIWFATNTGLTRYDGTEYKTYSSSKQTSAAGSSIKEDALGRIWYENFDGYLYYVENDTLKALPQNKPVGYLPICITSEYLFVLQKTGIDVYTLADLKRIKTIPFSVSDVHHCTSNNNNFYLVSNESLYKIDTQLKVQPSSFTPNKSETTKQIYCNNNHIYMLSKYNEQKNLYVFDENLHHINNITIKAPNFINGSNLIDSLIWVYSNNGAFAYGTNNKTENTTHSIFKNKSISCIIKDRQNNYWISTTNDGVFMVPNITNIIYETDNYLPNKMVHYANEFFITTKKNEILKYDKQLNFLSAVSSDSDNSEIYYLTYDSITNDLYYTGKTFTHIPKLNKQHIQHYNIAIKELSKIDNSYYAFAASGNCGIANFNKNNADQHSIWDSSFYAHQNVLIKNTASLINDVRGKSVAYNKLNNTIYFATNVGLFKIVPKQTIEIKHNSESFYASKIVTYHNTIYTLNTKGDLYQIKNETDFEYLNSKLNINEHEIKSIKLFEHKLIIVCQHSVYQLNLNTNEINKFDVNISPFEVTDVLLQKNNLFIIANAGILKTSTLTNDEARKNVSICFNTLLINNKKESLTINHTLKYYENNITLHFSVLNFGSIQQNQLYYRINNENWTLILNDSRTLQFASLAPGSYKIDFKINDIVSNETLQFTIMAPFWKKAWFIFLCFVTTTFIGFIYYRWQLKKLQAKNSLLEEKNTLLQEKIELEHNLNKSVLKSIKAQMNPHFFYNALNTIQAYIFTNEKAKANTYLAKFSKLTRVILEQSEKETISLSEEIESLTLYLDLEKMRFKEGFEYCITHKINGSKDDIEFPPMLIQPYVENAIKHGLLHKDTDKKLDIVFEELNGQLIITIDDNGIGRKRSEELNKIKNDKYQSFSTQANEKRLDILNRTNDNIAVKIIDKKDVNEQACGTKVVLIIPII